MFDIRKLINEAVRSVLLNEGLSDILYHFTSVANGYSICKEDTIYLQSAYAKESDNYDKKRKFYLSCTRLFNSSFGYASKFSNGGVRIKLDGRKLAQKFKGKPINYWNGMNDKFYYYKHLPKNHEEYENSIRWYVNQFKKKHPEATEDEIEHFINHNFNSSAQKHIDNETEDRFFSYEPSITNAHEYILSVDVLMPNFTVNPNSKKIVYAFFNTTKLRRLVKVYDNVEDFNKINGKHYDLGNYYDLMGDDVYDNVYNSHAIPNDENRSYRNTVEALKYTILFISYANHDFDGKNFAKMVSNLIQKYELTRYSRQIGDIVKEKKTWNYTLRNIGEHLNSLRRDLSDMPNRDNANILKMLTDYLLSIGANSFREGYQIKDSMANEYYNTGKIYDKIDTSFKKEFMIFGNYCIVIEPTKEKFADLAKYGLNSNEDDLRYYADSLSYEIANEYSQEYTYNKEKTKNVNSMFQYIYKLFRKGTVAQVMQAFDKMSATNILCDMFRIDVKYEKMDYWEASRYETINTIKYRENNSDYDWKELSKIKEKEFEKVFPKRVSN